MTLWVCGGDEGCGTKYAVGLFRCPRCHNTEFHEDGDPMAKITRHGGPSDKTLPEAEAASSEVTKDVFATGGVLSEEGAAALNAEIGGGEAAPAPEFKGEDGPETVHFKGGEESSPGSSSSASTEAPPTNSEQNEAGHPKPARKTASRSGKARTGSSSAPSTATDGQKTDGSDA